MKKLFRPAGNKVETQVSQPDNGLFNYQTYSLFQSGTAALSVAISICIRLNQTNIANPEILLPAYTCPDLVSAIVHAGAKPVPVDLETDSCSLSPELVSSKINENTIAVIVVNFLGIPGNLATIKSICERKNLFTIYDSAQWFPREGDYHWPGDLNIISFSRGKPINVLNGGALISNHPEIRDLIPRNNWGNPGIGEHITGYLKVSGYNLAIKPQIYRFINWIPGLSIGQTRYKVLTDVEPMPAYHQNLIGSNVAKYRQIARICNYLHDEISKLDHPRLLSLVDLEESISPENLLRYPILIKNPALRDLFYQSTIELGSSLLYKRELNRISGIENILDLEISYPNASQFANHLVTLPCHEDIDKPIVDEIISKLKQVLQLR